MPGIASIHEFLHDAHVRYSVVPHRTAFTAKEEAAAAHVPGRDWAKVVVCFIDGEPVQAVVPALSIVNLQRLRELAGGTLSVWPTNQSCGACFLNANSARCPRLDRSTARRSTSMPRLRWNPRSSSTPGRTAMRSPCVGTIS